MGVSQKSEIKDDISFYTKNLPEIYEEYATNPDEGLTEMEVKVRLAQHGQNKLPEPEKISLPKLFLKQFANFMIYILLGAVALSLFLQDYKDAILIGIVVVINSIIGFVQEYKAEKTLASLKKMSTPTAKVLRDGQIDIVSTEKLVVGDIVILEEGNIIPADVRLIESVGLEINESILTGESMPSQKDAKVEIENKVSIGDRINMAFMSTVIAVGNGSGVVVAIGADTQIGKIAQTLAIPYEKPTPLQKNLNSLGKYIVIAALVVSVAIFIIGFLQGRELHDLLFTVISLAVAVIPEGLVAVVTITMAIGVQRMARKNAIVRNLPSVETLGAVNVICSDKTGTLTEGKMVATDLWVGNKLYTVSGSGNQPTGEIYCDDEPVKELGDELRLAVIAMSLCNDAILQKDEQNVWEAVGDPTEIALQVLAHKLGVKRDKLEREWKFKEGLPFDSNRKLMSSIFQRNNETVVFAKGAPEELMSVCSHVIENGKKIALEGKVRSHFQKINLDMAGRGLRVLAIATRDLKKLPTDIEPDTIEKDMTLLGMVGVLDPARPEAKLAVEMCTRAGIRVLMVTGDHPATAANVATQLGIYDPKKDIVLSGEEMDDLTEEKLMGLNPFPTIFARVSPENKLMLVNALRKLRYVVAMTGDGVNDAAAIKHSNVGVAMGKEGTDVTRQAADIVLADDNFATIVAAVEEGRRIFTNIRKFIRYLLSCNFGNVFSIFLATVLGIPLPFTPVQILWLNLVTDTPPALALGFDKTDTSAMQRPPRNSTKGIFRKSDIYFILFHGILMASLMLGIFLMEINFGNSPIEKARTMAFAMLVLVQLTQAFNSRSTGKSMFRRDIFNNKALILGVGISFLLMIIGMYMPILSGVFEQVNLGFTDWAKLATGVGIYVGFAELFKFFKRRMFPTTFS